jgi:transposase
MSHCAKNTRNLSEAGARKYVISLCWKGKRPFCPRCGNPKIYSLSDGRWRCRQCKYTFHHLSGRWISHANLSARQWLILAKAFGEAQSAGQIAACLGVCFNTASKALQTLRFALAARAADAPLLFGAHKGCQTPIFSHLGRGRWVCGPLERVPVFGIRESDGRVSVQMIPHFQAETLFGLSIRKVCRRNVVYTDRFHDIDCFLFCGLDQLALSAGRQFVRGGVYVDAHSDFWRFARDTILGSRRCSSPESFPLLMKEMEFRYNHQGTDPVPDLMESLCSFAPGAFDTPSFASSIPHEPGRA